MAIKNAYPERMCIVERHGIEVPESAVAKVRRLFAEIGVAKEPISLAPDIWACGCAVGYHTDSTAPGKVTYGVILVADGYEPKLHYSSGNNGREYAVQPGSLYIMDGREGHSLQYTVGRSGLLAFLAWDMPYDFTPQGFARRALRRLNEWGRATQPFSQSGAGI